MTKILNIYIFLFFFILTGSTQKSDVEKEAFEGLRSRGEIYFSFSINGKTTNEFSNILSIDKVKSDTIFAYANELQFKIFLKCKIPFKLLTAPSLQRKPGITKSTKAIESAYPSYAEYIKLMKSFADSNSSICSLIKIGESIGGKEILAIKLSGNVNNDEDEPSVFYSAGIHGDEGSGVIMMLKLIEYLTNRYGKSEKITTLLDNCAVFINPLSNPDGFYFYSDLSNFGSKRFNLNNVDLNRNFPDAESGDHPDGFEWQPETDAMIKFMEINHFTISANFHDGVEVVNYPWDTWERVHPDNEWFITAAREYADTAQKYSEKGYFNYLDDGITNGYAWYEVSGSRQDYVTYFLNGREMTIELSDEKSPDSVRLEELWQYNRRPLINYMFKCLHGIKGFVRESETGNGLEAYVAIRNHDADRSYSVSLPQSGRFYRPALPGEYALLTVKKGYERKVTGIIVLDEGFAETEINLLKSGRENIVVNPLSNNIQISLFNIFNSSMIFEIFEISGRRIYMEESEVNTLEEISVDVSTIPRGFYILRLSSPGFNKTYKFVKK